MIVEDVNLRFIMHIIIRQYLTIRVFMHNISSFVSLIAFIQHLTPISLEYLGQQ